MTIDQFSEFEVKESHAKFGEGEAIPLGCVGSLEETMNTKTITKACEGVTKKTVVKPDGTGELKFSLHMRWAAFVEMFGLVTEGYKTGIYAYGTDSTHKHFCYTAKVKDEEGNVKYKAYPDCVVTDGIASKIENGAEEVSEIEVTAAVCADAYGNGMYEAFESEIDEDTKSKWLKEFSHDLVVEATA